MDILCVQAVFLSYSMYKPSLVAMKVHRAQTIPTPLFNLHSGFGYQGTKLFSSVQAVRTGTPG